MFLFEVLFDVFETCILLQILNTDKIKQFQSNFIPLQN